MNQTPPLASHPRPFRLGTLWAVGLAASAALLATGCAPSGHATYPQWQADLETYVRREANGDLNDALRSMNYQPPYRQWTVLGGADPEKSSDIVGLLLGREQIAGQPWYLFITGKNVEQDVAVIRPAAVRQANGELVWRLGPPDPEALEQYRRHRRVVDSPGDDRNRPIQFPGYGDSFDYRVESPTVIVTDRSSGARWQFSLAPESPPAE